MAISTKGKIKEMIKSGKADLSVKLEYSELEEKYKNSKQRYKEAKVEQKEAEEQLSEAQAKLRDTPFMKKRNVRRRVRLLRKKLEIKKDKCKIARDNYKSKLKAFRNFKNTVRAQSKACKTYEKFFAKVVEAQNLGIEIPRYIREEAKLHWNTYKKEMFSIDREGETRIEMPHIECAKDISSLIAEKKAKDAQMTIQKVVAKVKGMRNHQDDKER